MTETQYLISGCENQPCEFVLRNKLKVIGVASTFFSEDPRSYQLVSLNNLPEFQKYLAKNDKKKLKSLYRPLSLEDVVSAKRLDWFEPI
jgi:hypothetical protein